MNRMPESGDGPAGLSLPDYLPYRLSVASNHVSALITRAYQDRFGISIWEWRVVAVLGGTQPMTAQALVEATAMDKVTVSRAVRSLVDKAYVARKRHHSDGRSAMVRLTEAGRTMYDEIVPSALELEKTLLEGFSVEEIGQMMSVLQAVEAKALALTTQRSGDD